MRKLLFALLLLTACGKKPETCCTTTTAVERAKDPVCGMWVEKKKDLYPLLYEGVMYYFCCNECAVEFSGYPDKFATRCNCSKHKRCCDCEHCQGKQVPCDCR